MQYSLPPSNRHYYMQNISETHSNHPLFVMIVITGQSLVQAVWDILTSFLPNLATYIGRNLVISETHSNGGAVSFLMIASTRQSHRCKMFCNRMCGFVD